MNRRKKLFLQMSVVLILAAVGILTNHGVALPTEAQVIKIEAAQGGIVLEPQALTINKNAVVIWMSGVPKGMVKIVFDDPVACQEVYADPKLTKLMPHFYDCYTTTYLRFGDTASLQFNKPGVLPYTVQSEDGKMKVSGKLTVK